MEERKNIQVNPGAMEILRKEVEAYEDYYGYATVAGVRHIFDANDVGLRDETADNHNGTHGSSGKQWRLQGGPYQECGAGLLAILPWAK